MYRIKCLKCGFTTNYNSEPPRNAHKEMAVGYMNGILTFLVKACYICLHPEIRDYEKIKT